MSNQIYYAKSDSTIASIKELRYGTIITNVKGYPKCVYMKVDRERVGNGITIGYQQGKSLLLNLNSGTMRIVCENEMVTVLDANIELRQTSNLNNSLGEDYRMDRLHPTKEDDC